jgi:anti-sigma B factor antagonist/stage II sporulation protein AA (anti-sigma F factor antagonist)
MTVSSGTQTGVFAIERQQNGTAIHLAVSGELDLCNAPRLRDAYAREDGSSELIVVDLSQVSFMDSSGLHALLDIHEADKHRLRLILSPPAARVIDICKLRTSLPIIEG